MTKVKVFYGTSMDMRSDIVDSDTSLMSFLNSHNVEVTGAMTLNSQQVSGQDFNKSFADYGNADTWYLFKMKNNNNA